MPIDIETSFKSNTSSIFSYLGDGRYGFIIPVFQRDYAWDQPQVRDLIEDIVAGVNTIYAKQNKSYCSYIGTVITAEGNEVAKRARSTESPDIVWSLIDGQQRLSSILLIALSLIYQFNEAFSKLKEIEDKSKYTGLEDLHNLLENEIGRLKKVLTYETHNNRQILPKIIRAQLDSWTSQPNTFLSPIPFLIMRFFELQKENQLRSYFRRRNPPRWPQNQRNFEFDRFSNIHTNLEIFIANSESESWFDRLSTYSEIIDNLEITSELLRVRVRHLQAPTDEETIYFQNILRVVVFSRYFLDRVAFTVVRGMNEEVAFEVFESINTTGTALGPYETFKPKVVRLVDPQNYESSSEKLFLDKIDAQLRVPNTPNQKNLVTINTIINFSLAYDGQVVTKRLSDQVTRLRETFEMICDSESERLKYLHLFLSSTHISYLFWRGEFNENNDFIAIVSEHDDVMLCCQFLSDIRHTIVHPLISRFYSDFLEKSQFGTDDHSTADDVRSVIKAITAFSILWRAAWGGTAGIDSIYRKLMGKYAYINYSDIHLSSISLKNDLREALLNTRVGNRGVIGDQKHWRELARSISIYSQRELCKFLLLAAQHNCVVDTQKSGLIIKGARNSYSCWSRANFRNSQYWIEHIAPAAPVAGQWDQDIYEDIGFKDRLGNLVVMPYLDNILAGNQTWENKKRIYSLLTESDLTLRKSKWILPVWCLVNLKNYH